MAPRATLLAAFGAGLVLGTRVGTRAGRARPGAPGTGPVPVDKVVAVVRLGAERARDVIGARLGWRDGDTAEDALSRALANELAAAFSEHRVPVTPALPARRGPHRCAAGARAGAYASSR